MNKLTTSEQRVDSLLELSHKTYPALDEYVDGETRARRILRLGIQVVAHTLESSTRYYLVAGDHYHALLQDELSGHISPTDYHAWPAYQDRLTQLPRPQPALIVDAELDRLATAYADVRRTTIAANGEDETDASHATHLSAIALPYAAQYHPDLDQSKIAIYSLIHDVVETYAGDTPSLGMSKATEARKHAAEAAALERITTEFTAPYPRFVAMIHDYEALVDDEAKFVKTFDKLDPSFTHYSNRGLALRTHHGLRSEQEFWHGIDQSTQRIAPYGAGFPDLLHDRLELIRRVASMTPWDMA